MRQRNLLYIFISVSIFGVLLYACKNPGEGVTINVNTYVLKAPTAVQFVNAVKNAPNQPKDFAVTIGGKDADKIVNASNNTEFSAKDGRIIVALKKGVVPSATNPIEFTVAAEIPGFTPATKSFLITTDRPSSTVVQVIEYANPVPGTTVKVQEDALQGGITTTPIVVETQAPAGATESATVSIAAGTQFLDAAGRPIVASKLESRVVQFGTESPEALASFPGGFDIASITNENGQQISGGGAFITAGFIAMDMFAGGTEVKSFSKPLEVEVGISSALQNPETGTAVKAGDVLPVWSLDDKTGQWSYESDATIEADPQGKLTATFFATHLSYWNFDWLMPFCTTRLNISFNASGYVAQTYIVEVESEKGYRSSSYVVITNGLTVPQVRVPVGQLRITVRDLNYVQIARTNYFDGCSGNITVNMPATTDLDVVDVKMTLQGVCPNQPVNGNISAFATFYEKGSSQSSGVTVYLRDGKLDITLKNNTEYSVTALYGNTNKTATIKFVKNNFTFPGTMSGTAVYDQVTNTVNVLAQFALPNCQ
ncbi:MAG: hypothetical protein EOO92_06215 [Pedobacter sp.]|nr:MAG: hypothetical protein EOO92_06215 [Pedobacter sp.]